MMQETDYGGDLSRQQGAEHGTLTVRTESAIGLKCLKPRARLTALSLQRVTAFVCADTVVTTQRAAMR